ncbi:MAG TPA: hypothetical protein VK433_11085, partial [Stellaceae bacterium]|nr:hypothetical protein [Stellaceae bacterium]
MTALLRAVTGANPIKFLTIALLLLAGIAAMPFGAEAQSAKPKASSIDYVDRVRKLTFTDDFDQMVKRGYIRVLVVFSKTYYFIDKGQQRGITYE